MVANMGPEQAMMQSMMGMGAAGGGPPPEAGPAPPAGPPMGPPPGEMPPGEMPEEAAAGAGGDTVLGHLTPGEVVIPKELMSNSTVQKSITSIFEEAGIPMETYIVGSEENQINAETGHPEFFFGFGRRRKRKRRRMAAARQQETMAHEARMKRIQEQIDTRAITARSESAARKAEADKKFRGEQVVSRAEASTQMSALRKEEAGLAGAARGVTEEKKAVATSAARSIKKKAKRRKRYLKRRPQ